MVPFTLAYLITVVVAVCLSPSLAVATGLGVAGATFLVGPGRLRIRRAVCAGAACGAVQFMLVSEPEPPPVCAAEPMPVSLEATVTGPPRAWDSGWFLPCSKAPAILVPHQVDPPLPGTRIRVIGRLDAAGDLVSCRDPSALTILAPPPLWSPGAMVERTRRALRSRLERNVGPWAAGHLRALVLGDPLPPLARERLARTGALHFFAISGLHIALLTGILRPWLGRRARAMLPPVILYAAISGLRTPVGRALIMLAAALFARALRRPPSPAAHLALGLVVLLSLNPFDLGSASLLLSFSAYAGITLVAAPYLDRKRRDPLAPLVALSLRGRLRMRFGEILIVSASAFAFSLPATVALFHRATPAALVASIVLAPLVPLLMVIAAVKMALPDLPLLALAAEGTVGVLDWTVAWLDRMPLASVDVPGPSVIGLVVLCLALVLWAHRVARARPCGPVVALLALGCVLLPEPFSQHPRGMVLLHGGRGSAILAASPSGTYLIDAGPRSARVAEQLLARAVGRVDGILVTHGHDDHVGGIADVEERIIIGRSGIASPLRGEHPASDVQALWPVSEDNLGTNDGSRVYLVQGRGRRSLIPGDLETTGLYGLLRTGDPPSCDLVMVPHHGSRNGALLDLLARTLPDRAWVSARAAFPDESTDLLLAWCGIPVDRTWQDRAPQPVREDLEPAVRFRE
jgi:competence protein ComEC